MFLNFHTSRSLPPVHGPPLSAISDLSSCPFIIVKLRTAKWMQMQFNDLTVDSCQHLRPEEEIVYPFGSSRTRLSKFHLDRSIPDLVSGFALIQSSFQIVLADFQVWRCHLKFYIVRHTGPFIPLMSKPSLLTNRKCSLNTWFPTASHTYPSKMEIKGPAGDVEGMALRTSSTDGSCMPEHGTAGLGSLRWFFPHNVSVRVNDLH